MNVLKYLESRGIKDNPRIIDVNGQVTDFYLEALLEDFKKELLTLRVSISLLKRYIQHVEKCEGVNFVVDIGAPWSDIEFSKEEKDLLEKLDKEIEESKE